MEGKVINYPEVEAMNLNEKKKTFFKTKNNQLIMYYFFNMITNTRKKQ